MRAFDCESGPLIAARQLPNLANPKDIAGAVKPQLHLLPPVAMVEMARVMEHGADKYGAWNWRDQNITLTAYLSALLRHTFDVVAGEDIDPESGVPHMGHIMATAAIVLDAGANRSLIDDRPGS
jgi:hypothetical protein